LQNGLGADDNFNLAIGDLIFEGSLANIFL